MPYTTTALLRATVTRFAPVVVAVMVGITLVDLVQSGNVSRVRDIRLHVAALEVLGTSAAYALVLLALRPMARPSVLQSGAVLLAGGVAVLTLFILSFYSGPARTEKVALLSVAAGALAALLAVASAAVRHDGTSS